MLFFYMLTQLSFCQKSMGATILKAIYNEKVNEVKLVWEKSDKTIRQYTLQHSTDEKNWIDIAQQMVKETDGTKKDWLNFISDNKLQEWSHVYYSKEADKARTDNGIPGYSQLYDVQSFPTLYLLDKEKRIIAKKLTYQQLDEIVQLKKKGQ